MAQSKSFKTDTGVSIFVPGRPDPIRVNAGEPYETSDKAELDALGNSAEVTEAKSSSSSSGSKGKNDG